MTRKRRLYLANGLRSYAEVTIADEPEYHVTITWYAARDDVWIETATATGTTEAHRHRALPLPGRPRHTPRLTLVDHP